MSPDSGSSTSVRKRYSKVWRGRAILDRQRGVAEVGPAGVRVGAGLGGGQLDGGEHLGVVRLRAVHVLERVEGLLVALEAVDVHAVTGLEVVDVLQAAAHRDAEDHQPDDEQDRQDADDQPGDREALAVVLTVLAPSQHDDGQDDRDDARDDGAPDEREQQRGDRHGLRRLRGHRDTGVGLPRLPVRRLRLSVLRLPVLRLSVLRRPTRRAGLSGRLAVLRRRRRLTGGRLRHQRLAVGVLRVARVLGGVAVGVLRVLWIRHRSRSIWVLAGTRWRYTRSGRSWSSMAAGFPTYNPSASSGTDRASSTSSGTVQPPVASCSVPTGERAHGGEQVAGGLGEARERRRALRGAGPQPDQHEHDRERRHRDAQHHRPQHARGRAARGSGPGS